MTTVASLFDGIGGTPLAARLSGAECLWCSEIDKFPQMVTKHHFPSMKHYGDITKINGAKVEPVDIIVGGSPCQDLSVAGKRQGMKHSDFGDEETTRSGLFMEQIRIVKEMRNATETNQPRFMVWENVPGAFSSRGSGNKLEKGDAFRIVLEETAKIKDKTISIPRPVGGKWANAGCIMGDGFSIAWRTYDAQYWGVAQRRRRIYLVADFGGQSAPEILFEQPCLPGNSTESGREGQGAAEDVERSVDGTICFEPRSQDGVPRVSTNGVCPTINTAQGGQRQTCVCLQGSIIGRADKNSPQGSGINEEVSFALNTTDRHAVCFGISSYASNAMKSGNPHSGIAVCSSVGGFMQAESEMPPTLMARDYKDPHVVSQQNKLVRRLTPLECERLQGYPDGWTDIPGASDTARYKALGNSFAMPNILFVMQRCVEMTRCEI